MPTSLSGNKWREHAPALVLVAIWLLAIALADPRGDFPTNDDWCYARVVKNLVQAGHVSGLGTWIDTTLIAHVLWGALFSIPFGFSFFVLRLSTVIMGVVGLLSTNALMRELKFDRFGRLLGMAALGFCPWYFHLSCSFMTDVPFVALCMLASFYFVRELRTGSNRDLMAGIAVSIAAMLIRQYGLLLPIAWGCASLAGRSGSDRRWWRTAWPVVITVGVLTLHQGWISPQIGLRGFYNSRIDMLLLETAQPWIMLYRQFDRLCIAMVYLGLAGTPFWILMLHRFKYWRGAEKIRMTIWYAVALTILLVWICTRSYRMLPLADNIIYNFGLGPGTLRDVFELHLNHLPAAPKWGQRLMTGFSLLEGAAVLVLIALAIQHLRQRTIDTVQKRIALFAVSFTGIYLAAISATGFFDRYILNLFPALLVLCAVIGLNRTDLMRRWRIAALSSLVLISLFDIAATHDYFSWNRVRWEMLRDLTAAGVGPERIDGGYEFNGWYTYNAAYQKTPDRSWWWVIDDEYMLTFGEIPGFEVETIQSYPQWLPPGGGRLYLLHKITPAPGHF